MKNHHVVELIAFILLIVGGLNLGLMGLFSGDVISSIFGETLSRIIFVLIGLAAIYRLAVFIKAKAK